MIVPQIDKKNPARQVEVKFVLDNFKLAIGVKKDETRLLEEVDKWVAHQHQERQAERSQQEVLTATTCPT